MFDSYELEDGSVVKVTGLPMPAADAAEAAAAAVFVPTEEDVREAEEGVQQWADYIRSLKEQYGKTNQVRAMRCAAVQSVLRSCTTVCS